jgi:triosephosphate isomerase (TIM)
VRQKIVAGNWKLNGTVAETRQLIRALRNRLAGLDARAEVVVCPPFVSLEAAVDAARGSAIQVGAQNVFWERTGAYTGEVSAEMLEAVGVRRVLIGHSERRTIFGETDADVNRKLHRVLSGSLQAIVCVGETLEEREGGLTEGVIGRQVAAALGGVSPEQAGRIVLAYEPVWAIGTGRTASPEMANDVHILIRGLVAGILSGLSAGSLRILYGGSVKPENAASIMSQSDIDGVLVGGASLDPAGFAGIIGAAR